VLLFALHRLVPGPGSGGAMVERFFLWQVVNLFERPHGAPLGVVLAALVTAWLVWPGAAVRSLRIGGVASLAVIATALAWAAATTGLDLATARTAIDDSLSYPLEMFWYVAATTPLTMMVALGLVVARLCGLGGEWPVRERVAHLGWVGWMLWFGVIESGITTNYLVLPIACLMAAIGMDVVALAQQARAMWPGRRAQVARAALTGVALLVVAEAWSGSGPPADRLASARPTIVAPGMDVVRSAIAPSDRVACTDELACLLLVGRVDAWLALDDHVRERFVIDTGAGRIGVYAGAPVVDRPRALMAGVPARVIVIDVFKVYPVGPSERWLPRALAEDGVRARTWIETHQLRVVELTADDQEPMASSMLSPPRRPPAPAAR
jgi:hypothetical protein